jgi:predicted nucleic acid-binding protein
MAPPEPAFGGDKLVVDMSAYARQSRPAVREQWRAAVANDQLLVCPAFRFEALHSTVNHAAYAALDEELTGAFDQVPFTEATWELAFAAARQLSQVAATYHRRPMPDLLIAAAAHENGVGVLHYDEDYDRIVRHTDLAFASEWIAPPGSLDLAAGNPRRERLKAVAARLAQFPERDSVRTHDRVIAVLDEMIAAAGLEPVAGIAEQSRPL